MATVKESDPMAADLELVAESTSLDALHAKAVGRLLDGENAFDHWLIRWSDRVSPILVKETRQALKSRQFHWTFLLLMLAIVGWTVFATLSMIPGIYYFPTGSILLMGYLLLLLIPTIIIVPNAAYHSMASELDHGTFDVLTISPLTPMKVVSGKLAVAMVQSLIYFSALAPCIALTYLLRGVPISVIGLMLGWVAVVSFLCASAGLMLASINRVGQYSSILSVGMIIIALAATFILFSALANMIGFSSALDPSFAVISLLVMVVLASYGWLMVLAASASIGIAGENYSTPIRWWTLLQSTLVVLMTAIGFASFAPTGVPTTQSIEHEGFVAMLIFLAIHWGVIGAFFVGESGATSPRAQRSLPDTLLTRLFFTWTNPGSGPGYFFVLGSYAGVVAMTLIGWYARLMPTRDYMEVASVGLAMLGYLIVFLGSTRIFLLLLPNARMRMLISVCFMAILVAGCCFSTLVISYLMNNLGEPSYEWYSILNVFWSSVGYDKIPFEAFTFLGCLSVIVFALNVHSLTRDIVLVRVKAPERVRGELWQNGEGSEDTTTRFADVQ